MLRHFENPKGGVNNYTQNLLRAWFRANLDHEFVLIYQDPSFIGKYSEHPRVRELAISCRNKLLWDQVVVPWVERQEKLDLIFNPKYSVPLSTRCPTVFVCHGLDWYVMPWGSKYMDRLSHRFLIPLYAKKADGIIAVSKSTATDCQRFLKIPETKQRTIYHGIGQSFLVKEPDENASTIAAKYSLPKNFLLFVGGIYPAKNFARLIRAYAKVGPDLGLPLIVAGEHMYLSERGIKLVSELGVKNWVRFVGWINHVELPIFYQRARALLLPSLYEACPSPILEAMAIGCPVVTGNNTGMCEIAGDAALLVDSHDESNIAAGIRRIATDESLRSELVKRGKSKANYFNWDRCASETIEFLECIAAR
jgi:glycosyltransferase involved in cell wall biosynthesis